MAGRARKCIAPSLLAFLLASAAGYAEQIIATCDEPQGTRLRLIDGEVESNDGGYFNSSPTFYFSTEHPNHLIESWRAPLPFAELISMGPVAGVLPPTAIEAAVLYRTDRVIHAISHQGKESYTTTLYLNADFAVFTRVRIAGGESAVRPMGAVYTAHCMINTLRFAP